MVSAHRTPDDMFDYAENAAERGIRVIIAGAGGAAHLPGMLAAKTTVPVPAPVPRNTCAARIAVSIVQMPKGVPVATFAIGEAGAANAGPPWHAGDCQQIARAAVAVVPRRADGRRPRDAGAAGHDRQISAMLPPALARLPWRPTLAACLCMPRRRWATRCWC